MEGDACSRHPDRMAIGYYATGSYGLNGCVECMKNNGSASKHFYDLKKARKVWNANKRNAKKEKAVLLKDDKKSIGVSTNRGDHWVLFGKDKIAYLNDENYVRYAMKFKDKRSYYYDSSD
jgi:hypothetical protein